MRIGLRLHWEFSIDSIRRIYRAIHETLSARHEVVFLPPEYPCLPEAERERMFAEFLGGCDVIASLPDPVLAAARQRLGCDVPIAFITLGDLPQGAPNLRWCLPYLTTRDVLLVNCASDLEIANRFFRNARVRVVPFSVDPAAFYPLDEEERRAVREKLRFGESDRIILYAGRISPEKHVHTLLRVFGVVARRVPEARLVIAGPFGGGDVLKLHNVVPVSYFHSFSRFISKLDLSERLNLVGHVNTRRLRELYNIADVKVNLTLNPDENFGLAQVESMACGTPVVGTAWGGLKDTIVEGVTGHKVSTVVTATGVKLNWWEAINRIVALLEDRPARERYREACLREAVRYSQAAYGALLEEVLSASSRDRGQPAEPLQATPFAQEFWAVCDERRPGAPFRRGPRSEELYRELVAPFTAVSAEHVAAGEALEPGQVLSLATPVDPEGDGGLRVDHPLYPFRIEVPPAYRYGVRAILAVMREEPAITVGRLTGSRLGSTPAVLDALAWMLDAGLVLRNRPMPGWIAPGTVDRRMSEVLFCVQQVDRKATDLIVYQ